MHAFNPGLDLDVSLSVLSQLARYLSALKIDTAKWLMAAKLDPEILKKPDERIPAKTYVFLEDEAAIIACDPYLGLHMGEFVEPGSWSILGYMMMNCESLGKALVKGSKYSRILGNMIQAKGGFHKGKIKVVYTVSPRAPKLSRHCFEAVLSGSIRMLRKLSGKEVRPKKLTLGYPAPGPTSIYERIFQCPIEFDAPETAMFFDPAIIHMPVIHPDASMLAHFEEYARKYIEEIDSKDDMIVAVTKLLLSNLDDSNLSIWTIAKAMRMSVRTLQTRLSESGKPFSVLLRETRVNLAKKYLRENYSVEDITYLLGFSDPSVFRKAFKKWSGLTPKEFRQGAL